jgi:hypothetical protein
MFCLLLIRKLVGQTRWQKYFAHASRNHASDGNCRKAEQGAGSMRFTVPGIFIVCCEHGVVYGFHIMVDPEGRKDLFYTLYERFPQESLDKLTVVHTHTHALIHLHTCALAFIYHAHMYAHMCAILVLTNSCRFMILLVTHLNTA